MVKIGGTSYHNIPQLFHSIKNLFAILKTRFDICTHIFTDGRSMDTKKHTATNIRLPKDLYTDLRAIATANNVTVTEYMRDLAKPYTALQNPTRYRGLTAIREAIIDRTSRPDKIGIDYILSEPAPTKDFHGITLFSGGGELTHRIVKYEGESTADVVSAYAEKVWTALNKRYPEDDTLWLTSIEEVCNSHRFVIGRVNFESWEVFDSSVELDTWRRIHGAQGAGAVPDNEKEWAIWGWAKTNLPTLYETGSKNTDEEQSTSGELSGQIWLNVYSDVKKENMVEEWARICVKNYHETGHGAEELATYDFRFTLRTIRPPRKKRIPHIKELELELA